jgi:DNA-binding transcriptional regulator YbjK
MIAHLSAITEEEQYHCKVISNDTIKIHVATPGSYRKLIKHTYQMKQERANIIVIRNLHYSTSIAQITAELEKQGHKV